jgi:hypothetical protein
MGAARRLCTPPGRPPCKCGALEAPQHLIRLTVTEADADVERN